MLCLILRCIQDQSESALELLKTKVEHLDIKKLEGEDVEKAVGLIKSTLRALRNASTDARSFVPMDFTKTVMTVLQTTSVPEFNDTFKRKTNQILTLADEDGVLPIWPDASSVLKLALNTYKRYKFDGTWDGPMRKSKALLIAQPSPKPPSTSYKPRDPQQNVTSNITCWGCGGPHHLDDCPHPRDEAKIEANRLKFKALRRSKGKPRNETDADGEPLILNKNGHCVLDQKKWKALKAALINTGSPNQDTTGNAQTNNTNSSPSESGTGLVNAICNAVGRNGNRS